MDIKNTQAAGHIPFNKTDAQRVASKKEEMAMEFERIFARHLVEQMTKDSFKMSDSMAGMGSFSQYREHVTDILANEIANQKSLGMADLVMKHWNKGPAGNG